MMRLFISFILFFNISISYGDCVKTMVKRAYQLSPRSNLHMELAIELCEHIPSPYRDYLLVIASIESDMQQINSSSNKDIGIFQIHVDEIKRRGVYKRLLETNIPYQIYVSNDILLTKYEECKKVYPVSWPACYHSATKTHHYRYWKIFKARYNKIRRIK